MSVEQQILLSMEIPYKHLQHFYLQEDIGFCIAPYVREKKEYIEHYKLQVLAGKRVILDNGMYEQGVAINNEELIKTAKSLVTTSEQPYIIAPDVMGDSIKSYELTTAFREQARWNGLYRIGAVVHGKNVNEMINYYKWLVNEGFEPICITFLENRIDLLRKLRLEYDIWHHFLGMTTIEEIKYIRSYIPLPRMTSIDTCKPIKAALHNLRITQNVRGLGTWSPTVELDEKAIILTLENIKTLKFYLQASLPLAKVHKRYATQEELCGTESSFQKKDG